jgi:hypothetical protein
MADEWRANAQEEAPKASCCSCFFVATRAPAQRAGHSPAGPRKEPQGPPTAQVLSNGAHARPQVLHHNDQVAGATRAQERHTYVPVIKAGMPAGVCAEVMQNNEPQLLVDDEVFAAFSACRFDWQRGLGNAVQPVTSTLPTRTRPCAFAQSADIEAPASSGAGIKDLHFCPPPPSIVESTAHLSLLHQDPPGPRTEFIAPRRGNAHVTSPLHTSGHRESDVYTLHPVQDAAQTCHSRNGVLTQNASGRYDASSFAQVLGTHTHTHTPRVVS